MRGIFRSTFAIAIAGAEKPIEYKRLDGVKGKGGIRRLTGIGIIGCVAGNRIMVEGRWRV